MITCLVVMHCFVRHASVAKPAKGTDSTKLLCDEDYSPCECWDSGSPLGNLVTCVNLTFPEIKRVLTGTRAPSLYRLSVVSPSTEQDGLTSVPESLSGDKHVAEIDIACSHYPHSTDNRLVINADAFRSSAERTALISIRNCDDLTGLDFNFLAGFSRLQSLTVSGSRHVGEAFGTLPALPALVNLTLDQMSETSQLAATFPNLTPARLQLLEVTNSDMDAQSAASILSAVADSTSRGSLAEIHFQNNRIANHALLADTQHQHSSLHTILLQRNNLTRLSRGAIAFTSPVQVLDLSDNSISEMESGSLQGTWSIHFRLSRLLLS